MWQIKRPRNSLWLVVEVWFTLLQLMQRRFTLEGARRRLYLINTIISVPSSVVFGANHGHTGSIVGSYKIKSIILYLNLFFWNQLMYWDLSLFVFQIQVYGRFQNVMHNVYGTWILVIDCNCMYRYCNELWMWPDVVNQQWFIAWYALYILNFIISLCGDTYAD